MFVFALQQMQICKLINIRLNMELSKIINNANFEFKKKFGQNFISDTNLLQAICDDASLCKTDEVLEIGVGAGTLTKQIAKNCKRVVGYEIDTTLKDVLAVSLKGVDNATVVFNDFLKVEPKEISENFGGKFKVVANLPYYVTTDIIFKLLDEQFNIDSITIMVQKEVAQRLVAKNGTKDYGTITAQLDCVADVKITRIVNRQMFVPAPNVDSAIVNIKLNRNKYQIKDLKLLTKVIRAGFSMRRKTLTNCLKPFNLTAEQLSDIYAKLGFEKTVRGESLSPKQYVDLANLIFDIK